MNKIIGIRHSVRFKLTLLFLVTIIIPIVILVIELPSYYLTLVKKQESSLLEGTLTALIFDIDTYLDDLDRMTVTPYWSDDVMRALKQKSTFQWNLLTPYEQYEAEDVLSKELPNFLKNKRKDILGTILLPMDGSVYTTSPNGLANKAAEGFPFSKQDWYIQALKADGDVAFISVHMQNYLDSYGTEVFSVARLIKDPDSQRPLGVIMADADTIVLQKMMNGIRLSTGAIAAITDDKGKLIYSNRPMTASMKRQLAEGSSVVKGVKESYSVVSATVERSNWGIAVLSPESVIKEQIKRIYWFGSLFAGGGFIIAFILYSTVSRWMVRPFKRMIQIMKRVQRGDLHTFYPVKGQDEINQLGSNMNTMIFRLGELIDREYKAVLGQRNAEYRALQSQIHPHFLYNTLNGFIGLNRMGQSMLLERAILSLSGMLRYTLEHNDWAQIREEIDFLTKYCELQHIRFDEKMQVQIECDPETSPLLLPKLMLQPIVENAIIHGIEPSIDPCLLTIKTSIEPSSQASGNDRRLVIRIEDNGVGFDEETKQEGVGIQNVRNRLRLAFVGATLRIDSRKGQGTRVCIEIPFKEVKRV